MLNSFAHCPVHASAAPRPILHRPWKQNEQKHDKTMAHWKQNRSVEIHQFTMHYVCKHCHRRSGNDCQIAVELQMILPLCQLFIHACINVSSFCIQTGATTEENDQNSRIAASNPLKFGKFAQCSSKINFIYTFFRRFWGYDRKKFTFKNKNYINNPEITFDLPISVNIKCNVRHLSKKKFF